MARIFGKKELLGEKQLIEWRIREVDERAKIKAMANFVGQDRFKASLPDSIKAHLSKLDNMSVEQAREELNGIVTDNFQEKKDFIESFDNVIAGKVSDKDVETILYFIYGVRNNVFHGSKKIEMVKNENESQNMRLKIYTTILLVINDLLFEAVEQATKGNTDDKKWIRNMPQHD